MGSTGIEILNIGFQDAEQVAFIADQQMIQTLAANAADKSFTYRVRARSTKRRFNDINLGASGHCGKMLTIFLVIIAHQMLGTLPEWGGFSQLLSHPFVGGVTG